MYHFAHVLYGMRVVCQPPRHYEPLSVENHSCYALNCFYLPEFGKPSDAVM